MLGLGHSTLLFFKLTNGQNKLECLFLTDFSGLVFYAFRYGMEHTLEWSTCKVFHEGRLKDMQVPGLEFQSDIFLTILSTSKNILNLPVSATTLSTTTATQRHNDCQA